MSPDAASEPTGINADRAAGLVTIDWADGHRSAYDTRTLRLLCPCAFCQGEAGRPGWLDTGPDLTDAHTQLMDVRLVGSYALAPVWGDGHDTGYYTFESLRENCPCSVCAARRASSGASGLAGG
jgi:DUF971 family protein